MPSVLIVEDDPDIREALAQLLVDEGFHIELAANGREGLDRLALEPRPALVILDLMMPVLDGFKFRTMQLGDARFADIPVIVMSADPRLEGRALALGAVAFLRKPLDVEPLLELTRALTSPAARGTSGIPSRAR